jgi:hypothetical protein
MTDHGFTTVATARTAATAAPWRMRCTGRTGLLLPESW